MLKLKRIGKTFGISSAACLILASASPGALASTKENAEKYVAQQIAKAYSGPGEAANPNVDNRIGSAFATVAGCTFGDYFKAEGLNDSLELASQQVSLRLSG